MNARMIGGDQVNPSTARENARLFKDRGGRIYDIVVSNNSGGTLYVLLVDKATIPINGDVPFIGLPIDTFLSFFYQGGRPCANGIGIALSSTQDVVTLAGANGWFDLSFI